MIVIVRICRHGFIPACCHYCKAQRGNWQPIETAPNDGAFLVTDGAYIAEVFWKRSGSAGFPTTTDGYIFNDATHWMPCPEFPTPAETSKDYGATVDEWEARQAGSGMEREVDRG